MPFVTCPKQVREMEAVDLRRVGILAYSCPKQGQDFKPLAAPLHPNMGQVPLPPGFMQCNQSFMQCNAVQYMLYGVYCLLFRPAQMFSLHSWAVSTTTWVFVFLGSHNCIKVTLTICIRRSRWHPLLFLTTSPNTKSAVEPPTAKMKHAWVTY